MSTRTTVSYTARSAALRSAARASSRGKLRDWRPVVPIKAIKPKGFEPPDKKLLMAELDRLGRLTTKDMKSYPPWQPWKNPPPKTGRRAGGRRTGDLGKSWGYKVDERGGGIVLTIESDTAALERPYNKYVQGKKQTRNMRSRGWRKVSTMFAVNERESRRRIAAWAKVKTKR